MGCGCSCSKPKETALSDEQKQILGALEKCATPCAGKDIAAATGIDAKAVSCKVTALKNKGLIDSPERCKYAITAEGRSALKKGCC